VATDLPIFRLLEHSFFPLRPENYFLMEKTCSNQFIAVEVSLFNRFQLLFEGISHRKHEKITIFQAACAHFEQFLTVHQI
jgi:hypothetical protein